MTSHYANPLTGTVTIKAGRTTLAVLTLKSGRASHTLTAKQLKAAGYALAATYSGEVCGYELDRGWGQAVACGCKTQAEGATMLRQVAEGVLIHQSEFCQSNAVVVQGRAGVLLIDAGVYGSEMACLANDLPDAGQTVVAGFSTHPHWDHVLWHARFGAAPRYGTARCAAAIRDELSGPHSKDSIAEWIPPDIAEQTSWDLFGLITGLPAGTARIPWDGPQVRIIEHQAHAAGHAAPLAGLWLLEGVAGDVDVLVPGHGSIGGADQVSARIDQDRAYVQALRDAGAPDDPRVGPSATFDWMSGVHERQLQQLARRREREGTPG